VENYLVSVVLIEATKEASKADLFLVLRTGLEPVTYELAVYAPPAAVGGVRASPAREIRCLLSYIRAERVSVTKKSPF